MAQPGAPERIEIMQSQLGRVRGTGAARSGAHHWTIERITAIGLVPLSIWFIAAIVSHLGADQPAIAAWIARPVNATLLIALLALGFRHLELGMQVVYEDYIDAKWLQNAAILSTKGAAYGLALLGAIAVLKLALGHA